MGGGAYTEAVEHTNWALLSTGLMRSVSDNRLETEQVARISIHFRLLPGVLNFRFFLYRKTSEAPFL